MFQYLPDRNGIVPIIVRAKCIVKIDILEHKMKQSFAYLMDKVDNENRKPRSWSLIFDCQEAGLENANFDLLFFALEVIGKHFPLQPKYVIVYGIPWLLKPFVQMGMGVIPEEAQKMLEFVDTPAQLFEKFLPEHVPDFMGGLATKDYKEVPVGAKSIYEIGKKLFKLTDQQIKEMMEPFDNLLNNNSATKELEATSTDTSGNAISFIEEFD